MLPGGFSSIPSENMKVCSIYMFGVFLLVSCYVNFTESYNSDENIENELINLLRANENDGIKLKRPFCNAFTGCGKKRSYNYGNSMAGNNLLKGDFRNPVYKKFDYQKLFSPEIQQGNPKKLPYSSFLLTRKLSREEPQYVAVQ